MRKLEEVIKIKGTGIPNLKSKCIIRDSKKAMYLRSDGHYEVFYIKVAKKENVFGTQMPKRELYPSNENFGVNAWCITNYERALKKYNSL